MTRIFFKIAPVALALAVPLSPAAAQIAPGMEITDPSGAPVGTVKSVQGDDLVVKTDKHEVALPKSSFTLNAGKLLFGMTQAQLNAAVDSSLAAAEDSVKVGATVKGAQGAAIGTIVSVDGQMVTIALESGQKAQLSRAAVRGNAEGSVTTVFTAELLLA
jgi:preprotein translocase subunit YajC